MAWPIQVHSIDSDKSWQMVLARSGETVAQPISREIIFLSGQTINSAMATMTATMTKITIRRLINASRSLAAAHINRHE